MTTVTRVIRNPLLGKNLTGIPGGKPPEVGRGIAPHAVACQDLHAGAWSEASVHASKRDQGMFYARPEGYFGATPQGWNTMRTIAEKIGFDMRGVSQKGIQERFNLIVGLQIGKESGFDQNNVMNSAAIESGTPHAAIFEETIGKLADVVKSYGANGDEIGTLLREFLLHHPHAMKIVPYVRFLGFRSGVSEDEELKLQLLILLAAMLQYYSEAMASAQQETKFSALETQEDKRYNTAPQLYFDVANKIIIVQQLIGKILDDKPEFVTNKQKFEAVLASLWYFLPKAEIARFQSLFIYLVSLGHIPPYSVDQPLFTPLFIADFVARSAVYQFGRLQTSFGFHMAFIRGPAQDLAFMGPGLRGIEKLFDEDWQYGQFMISGESASGIDPSYKNILKLAMVLDGAALTAGTGSVFVSHGISEFGATMIGPVINMIWASYLMYLMNSARNIQDKFEAEEKNKELIPDPSRAKFAVPKLVPGETMDQALKRWRSEAYAALQAAKDNNDLIALIRGYCEEIDFKLLYSAKTLANSRNDNAAAALNCKIEAAKVLYELYETSGSRPVALLAQRAMKDIGLDGSAQVVLKKEIEALRESLKESWPPKPKIENDPIESLRVGVARLKARVEGKDPDKETSFKEDISLVEARLSEIIDGVGNQAPIDDLLRLRELAQRLEKIKEESKEKNIMKGVPSENKLNALIANTEEASLVRLEALKRKLTEKIDQKKLPADEKLYNMILAEQEVVEAALSLAVVPAENGDPAPYLIRLKQITRYENLLLSMYKDGSATRKNMEDGFRAKVRPSLYKTLEDMVKKNNELEKVVNLIAVIAPFHRGALEGLFRLARVQMMTTEEEFTRERAPLEEYISEKISSASSLDDPGFKQLWNIIFTYNKILHSWHGDSAGYVEEHFIAPLRGEIKRRTKTMIFDKSYKAATRKISEGDLQDGLVNLEEYNKFGGFDELIMVTKNRLNNSLNDATDKDVEKMLKRLLGEATTPSEGPKEEVSDINDLMLLISIYKGSRLIRLEMSYIKELGLLRSWKFFNKKINKVWPLHKLWPPKTAEKTKAHKEALKAEAKRVGSEFILPIMGELSIRISAAIKKADTLKKLEFLTKRIKDLGLLELLVKIADRKKELGAI